MPFRKKALYYGLTLLLLLLALEGMARIAYYAAYGQEYGRNRGDTPADAAPFRIRHPFYGHTRSLPYHALNETPPRPRRADRVLIGLVGGSVASDVKPFLERALGRYFAAAGWPRQPVLLELAFGGQRQPQQVMIAAHTLLLGGEFDLIINLDGVNEVAGSGGQNPQDGIFPFFSGRWHRLAKPSAEEILLAGRLAALRREQSRLAAAGTLAPLRRSALFGLGNRYRQERNAARISQRNHELAALKSPYSLEKHGPRSRRAAEELRPEVARFWYRSSLTLAQLAATAGADYYHFLQPNQYVPDSKPFSPEERESAYAPFGFYKPLIEQGYPLLREFNKDLTDAGVNYFDLTGIFADNRETLYIDACCHLNDRGYELLAAAMVQRLEPALRRLGRDSPDEPVSALAAARRPPAPDRLLVDGDFQVYIQGDGKYLRYVRDDCAAADTAARFFLHLTPRDLTDLPPHRREPGFADRDFSFVQAGGRFWRGQCRAEIRLPPYPIAYLRTGQYDPDAGELWAGEFPFPE